MKLAYYGYRYYNFQAGRWISIDPLGERGGLNLVGAFENNALTKYDIDGRVLGLMIAEGLITAWELAGGDECDPESGHYDCMACCTVNFSIKAGVHAMGWIVDAATIVGSPVTGCVGVVVNSLEIAKDIKEADECEKKCQGGNPIP